MLRLFIFLICPFIVSAQSFTGFLDYKWVDSTGQVILTVPEAKLGEEFLYMHSLAAGVGSNDLGLDRGQLGNEKVVYFYKSGNKLLLIQNNLKYRAVSNNPEEVKAVEEAFAKSVIFGFKILKQENSKIHVELNPFLLTDAHGVINTIEKKKEGKYKLDLTKSAIYKEGLFNFPNNSEFEVILTFTGEPKGKHLKTVTPTPSIVSVRQHHSFIQLPDNKYKPRKFHPECGYFYNSFYDYASEIGTDIQQRYILRHRLEKITKHQKSKAIEPIIYYLDRGCPEPVKSALKEGAQWWNQAFEAAGFINAFQVKELPVNAHPLDVRYNMIQWVHRSTRGWSYGGSISDPRTGEIIKGHVSLGSLRVRQDFMIAQGIISNFDLESEDPKMLTMALDRLKQLSAHEIGHTIGLAHNFAASSNNRASVMDYPHPYITMEDNQPDFKNAYDNKIGAWDKRAIIYGYGEPPIDQEEESFLGNLISENKENGLLFITDQDARPAGSLHPYAHLWDNGNDPIAELERMMILRKHVLDNLDEKALANDMPSSELEKVLVPAYLMTRFQVEAVSKLIAGYNFDYSISSNSFRSLPIKQQKEALAVLLKTLDYSFLKIPSTLLKSIPPASYGFPRTRENFKGTTGLLFDPLSAAEASANHTLKFLLEPTRLARLELNSSEEWSLESYLNLIMHAVNSDSNNEKYALMKEKVLFIHLLQLAKNTKINKQVSALALHTLNNIITYENKENNSSNRLAHITYLKNLRDSFNKDPKLFAIPKLSELPPGSPIGCH